MKMLELRDHLERLRRNIDDFSHLVNQHWRGIAQESRALANVNDSAWIESHQARTLKTGKDRR